MRAPAAQASAQACAAPVLHRGEAGRAERKGGLPRGCDMMRQGSQPTGLGEGACGCPHSTHAICAAYSPASAPGIVSLVATSQGEETGGWKGHASKPTPGGPPSASAPAYSAHMPAHGGQHLHAPPSIRPPKLLPTNRTCGFLTAGAACGRRPWRHARAVCSAHWMDALPDTGGRPRLSSFGTWAAVLAHRMLPLRTSAGAEEWGEGGEQEQGQMGTLARMSHHEPRTLAFTRSTADPQEGLALACAHTPGTFHHHRWAPYDLRPACLTGCHKGKHASLAALQMPKPSSSARCHPHACQALHAPASLSSTMQRRLRHGGCSMSLNIVHAAAAQGHAWQRRGGESHLLACACDPAGAWTAAPRWSGRGW